ncbi:MAG: signal peptidase II [Fibrobacteria bacterium]
MNGPTYNSSKTSGRIGLAILLAMTLAADQWTKYLARLHFGFPGGEPDYFKVKQVLGEWLQFRLIYNTGAAFGMKPQQFLPFLNPTVFYVLFSTAAIAFLFFLYRKLPREDTWQKAGLTLILSGAFGNLIDRLRFHKVTDFIDVGIPGYPWRWPTFNIADSCVCVGVAMILLSSWMPRRTVPTGTSADPLPEAPAPRAPAAPGISQAQTPVLPDPSPDQN